MDGIAFERGISPVSAYDTGGRNPQNTNYIAIYTICNDVTVLLTMQITKLIYVNSQTKICPHASATI